MSLPLHAAELVGSQIESVFFGVFWLILPFTLVILRRNIRTHGWNSMNAALLCGAVLLTILITTHWVLDQSRIWDAFINHGDKPHGPIAFFATYADLRNVIRIAIFIVEMAVLDLLLMFRVYIIWSKNFWILIPLALNYVGMLVACGGVVHGFATAPPHLDLFHSSTAKWISAAFSSDLIMNAQAVVYVAFKIIQRNRSTPAIASESLSSVIRVIIESSALTCLTMAITFGALLAHHTLNLAMIAIASPITGISFCLIILRVGLKNVSWSLNGPSTASHTTGRSRSGGPIIPMQVKIRREHQDFTEVETMRAPRTSMDYKEATTF